MSLEQAGRGSLSTVYTHLPHALLRLDDPESRARVPLRGMGQRAATSPQASRQKQTRRYRLRDPLRRLRLAAAFCLLSLCRIVAHDNQGTVPVVVELKTKPQEALEQVLWEEHQETEEPNPFLWLKKRLRENGSFSEMLRETIYTGEIERLNPTCAVIGLLLRTVPICPFVRRLEKCE